MSVVDSILNFTSNLGNWFSSLLSTLSNFFNNVLSVLSYILGILKALWYGLTSLLSGVFDLIIQVFNGGVFNNVANAFIKLSDYIGAPGVIFISTMLLFIIFRIGLAFVFKIFRLNIDYNSLQVKNKGWQWKRENLDKF